MGGATAAHCLWYLIIRGIYTSNVCRRVRDPDKLKERESERENERERRDCSERNICEREKK